MEEKVIKILREVFEDENIDSTCSQLTYDKWDSMAQLNLVVELESEFDIDLTPEEIASMKSVDDIMFILRKK